MSGEIHFSPVALITIIVRLNIAKKKKVGGKSFQNFVVCDIIAGFEE